MLYVITNINPLQEQSVEHQWHVGEPAPIVSTMIHAVIEVQADGDEIDYLAARFPFVANNLPQEPSGNPNGSWKTIRVVKWFGDDAKFIAGNLVSH